MATQRRCLDSSPRGELGANESRRGLAERAASAASRLVAFFRRRGSWQIQFIVVTINRVELTVSWVLGEESSLRTNRDLLFALVAT